MNPPASNELPVSADEAHAGWIPPRSTATPPAVDEACAGRDESVGAIGA